MLKKTCLILLAFICVITFSGCDIGVIARNVQERLSEWQTLDEESELIMQCFNNKDVNKLEDMFCEYTGTVCDLSAQISDAFDCIEGKILPSYHCVRAGMDGSKESDGTFSSNLYHCEIRDIKTDIGKKYEILFTRTFINDSCPEEIGIIQIYLRRIYEDGEEKPEDEPFWLAIIGLLEE